MIASEFTDRTKDRCMQTSPARVLSAISVVLGLVWGSPAAAADPLYPGPEYGAGYCPVSVAIDDLDAELAVANRGDDNVSILLNQDGAFAAEVDCLSNAGSAAPKPRLTRGSRFFLKSGVTRGRPR